MASVLLIVLPTVMIGDISLLSMVLQEPAYAAKPLRQDFWRTGCVRAGVPLGR